MTNSFQLQARSNAPIVCDMSAAEDTPDEHFGEYGRLFKSALLRRERRADGVVFYRVETVGGEVVWTTTDTVRGEERAAVDVILDAFHALPDHAGSDFAAYLGRLAERDVHVFESGEGFELRG